MSFSNEMGIELHERLERNMYDVPFQWRRVDYEVSGWLWSADGEGNGMIVRRVDGRKIRGASMRPGIVQIGLSAGLEKAARRALQRARDERDRRRAEG